MSMFPLENHVDNDDKVGDERGGSVLRYDDKRRVHHADDTMAQIIAERLICHLTRAGFVLMCSEPAAAPTTTIMPASRVRLAGAGAGLRIPQADGNPVILRA